MIAAAAVLFGSVPRPARAAESTALELARRGLAECEQGRRSTGRDERQAHFQIGQALGDRAVALDDQSAEAHFAVFCNMGELMRLDGEPLSCVFQIRRLTAEIDRTLELNPEYTEAMAAKGILLIRLPRLLGGNAQKGETLLRRVLQKDPDAADRARTGPRRQGGRGAGHPGRAPRRALIGAAMAPPLSPETRAATLA